jgi:anti-sigma B factor antagonist
MSVDHNPRFAIQSVVSPDRHTLVIGGELETGSVAELELWVRSVCADRPKELLLDITRLSFLDSAGLGAILRSQNVCGEHGVDFALTPGNEAVQRVFEITGMIDELPFTAGRLG